MAKLLQNFIRQPFKSLPVQSMAFSSSKEKPNADDILIVKALPCDYDAIIDGMYESFYPDEPVTNSLGLGFQRNNVFNETTSRYLSNGFSLVAKCKYDCSVVGAAINVVTSPWDPDMTEKFACTLKCEKLKQLYMFLAYLERAPNLWKRSCQSQIFEVANLFVRKGDRGKGVGKKLITESINLAADAGFKVVRVDGTHIGTKRICEKLKMILVHEIPYCSYIGEDNEPVIKSPEPNISVKTYVSTPLYPQKSR